MQPSLPLLAGPCAAAACGASWPLIPAWPATPRAHVPAAPSLCWPRPRLPAVWNLESQALRSSVDPLYRSLKEYICCDLSTNSSSIFTAWTVVGSLGLVLAVLCSARLVNDMLTMRRQRVSRVGACR